jgi:hypothetical protein
VANHAYLFISQFAAIASIFILGWSFVRACNRGKYFYLSGIVGVVILGATNYLLSIFSVSTAIFYTIIAVLFLSSCVFIIKDFDSIRAKILEDWKILLCATCFAFIAFGQLSTTPFVFDDEIYSWNYWAFKIINQQAIEFKFTRAPYPLFFSHFLAAVYKLVGTETAQLLVKSTLSIACFTIAITFLSIAKSRQATFLGFILFYFLFFGLSLRSAFSLGYADALANAFIISGVSLLALGDQQKKSKLLLAVALISAATLTKQFALIYCVLPIVYLFINKRYTLLEGLISCIPLLVALAWFLTDGSGFTNNRGVVTASLGGRSFLEQVVHISKAKYFGFVYIATLVCLLFQLVRSRRNTYPALICILISYILWSIYGSYDIRLGMNIFFLTWIFFIFNYNEFAQKANSLIKNARYASVVGSCLVVLTAIYGGYQTVRWKSKMPPLSSAFDNSDQQIDYLFGEGAFRKLSDNDDVVYATSNYSYGALVTSGFKAQFLDNSELNEIQSFIAQPEHAKALIVVSQSGVLQTRQDRKLLAFFSKNCADSIFVHEQRKYPFAFLPINCGS